MNLEHFDYAEVPYFTGYRCLGLYSAIQFNKEYDYFKLVYVTATSAQLIKLEWYKFAHEAYMPVYVRAEYGQPVVNKQGTPVLVKGANLSDEIDAAINDSSLDFEVQS
mgnify:CR=1 FL=1